jgi:ribosomal protein L7/L12
LDRWISQKQTSEFKIKLESENMADIKKLAEEIVGLTLLEAVELKNILKDEHGIEPAAGGAVMMAGPVASGEAGASAEDSTTCSRLNAMLILKNIL